MKSIGKAAEFLRKAAAAMRGKAGVLRARLLFLASLRRRAAVLAGILRHIRSLAPSQQRGQEEAAATRAMALVSSRPVDHADVDDDGDERAGARDVDVVVGMAELASLFQEVDADAGDGGGYQDWTLALHALFDDGEGSRGCGGDEHRRAGDLDDGVEGLEEDDDDDDEPSVLELIRSVREGEGQEFRIDDEIDRAADMFITRVRHRMSKQADHELVASGFH